MFCILNNEMVLVHKNGAHQWPRERLCNHHNHRRHHRSLPFDSRLFVRSKSNAIGQQWKRRVYEQWYVTMCHHSTYNCDTKDVHFGCACTRIFSAMYYNLNKWSNVSTKLYIDVGWLDGAKSHSQGDLHIGINIEMTHQPHIHLESCDQMGGRKERNGTQIQL